MPLYYPTPNITEGIGGLLNYNNTVTDNWFSPMILVAVFLLMMIGMKVRGVKTEPAFASSSFSVTLLAYVMALIPGFISPEIIVITTLITAISVIFLYRSGGNGA